MCVAREKETSVLTAQSNDVAAVFMDKFLSHCFLHNLLHLHTKDSKESMSFPVLILFIGNETAEYRQPTTTVTVQVHNIGFVSHIIIENN